MLNLNNFAINTEELDSNMEKMYNELNAATRNAIANVAIIVDQVLNSKKLKYENLSLDHKNMKIRYSRGYLLLNVDGRTVVSTIETFMDKRNKLRLSLPTLMAFTSEILQLGFEFNKGDDIEFGVSDAENTYVNMGIDVLEMMKKMNNTESRFNGHKILVEDGCLLIDNTVVCEGGVYYYKASQYKLIKDFVESRK